jgi:hypothetical protein
MTLHSVWTEINSSTLLTQTTNTKFRLMSSFGDETYGRINERNASPIMRSFMYKEKTEIDVK